MSRYILFFLMLLALGACGPISVENQATSTKVREVQESKVPIESALSPGMVVLTLKRSGGLAGKTEEWAIYNDGRIESGQGATQVDPTQVSQLISDLKSLGVLDLKDSYGGLNTCNDCFTYTISINTNGKPKTIKVTEGATDNPKEIEEMLKLINTFVSTPPTD